MGFLHKLWDETLAGPAPETGLGKLRKYNSFSATTRSSQTLPVAEEVPITRSIIIVRTHSSSSASAPASPSGSTTPRTPLTPEMPGGDFKKLTRRKSLSPGALDGSDHRSPTINDWVIMNALDRC